MLSFLLLLSGLIVSRSGAIDFARVEIPPTTDVDFSLLLVPEYDGERIYARNRFSLDGGGTWTLYDGPGSSFRVLAIDSFDEQHLVGVFMEADTGVVHESFDAGISWEIHDLSRVELPAEEFADTDVIRHVSFSPGGDIFFSYPDVGILKASATLDTFEQVFVYGENFSPRLYHRMDETRAFSIADGNEYLAYLNSGGHWQVYAPDIDPPGIYFSRFLSFKSTDVYPDSMFAVGTYAQVEWDSEDYEYGQFGCYSFDGGMNWNDLHLPVQTNTHNMFTHVAIAGFASCRRCLIFSNDEVSPPVRMLQGNTWQAFDPELTSTFENIYSIQTSDQPVKRVYMVFTSGSTTRRLAVWEEASSSLESPGARPEDLGLRIYPNPFNPTTTIRIELYLPGRVSMQVLDLAGRARLQCLDRTLPAGPHELPIDGSGLPSGVYLLRLQTQERVVSRKLLLLK